MKAWIKENILENKIISAVLVVLSLWGLYRLKNLVITVFIAYIVMAASLPMVNYLEKKRFPRALASLAPIILVILALVLVVLPIWSVVVEQIQMLISNIPQFVDSINSFLPTPLSPEQLFGPITSLGNNIFTVTGTVVNTLLYLFLIFFIAYYLLLDHERIKGLVLSLASDGKRASNAEQDIEKLLGNWVRGQIIVSGLIGVLYWIAYNIVGIPFALSLSVLAALFEVVPYIGPIASATPALILALTISPNTFLYLVIALAVIQFLESYIVVPKVMEKVVGVHPLVVVLGVLIFSTFLGILGTLLAVPIIVTITSVIKHAGKT